MAMNLQMGRDPIWALPRVPRFLANLLSWLVFGVFPVSPWSSCLFLVISSRLGRLPEHCVFACS